MSDRAPLPPPPAALRAPLLLLGALLLLLLGVPLLSSCTAGGGIGGGELSSAVPADSEMRANPGSPRDSTPQVLVAEQPGTAVASNEKAVLDYSNAASGYVCAMSLLDGAKVKVLVDSPTGERYQYVLATTGDYLTVPLSRGSGTYTVGIYENLYDEQYTPLLVQDVAAEAVDEFAPFLYPNQFVEFASGDQTVELSQELAANATSDVEAVDQIYLHVVQNFNYDYDKADSVAPGYLPRNDDTLASGTGICLDFAALTASLMRAQRLPTRLDVGYCGQAYHAWIEVYTAEKGWIRKKIEFAGDSWVLMDPTFDSASKGTGDIERLIGDGKNYQPILLY
ncbi:MAG: transglutaminase-like domain-containing protein [Coriobacteriales bacterium]|nr:transglutaminase-like domain-containing protein [Coriobacteriales bacterium]